MLKQITGETVGEVKAVSDMHQRKAEMARQADAFIALPGINFYSIQFASLMFLYFVSLLNTINQAVMCRNTGFCITLY